MDFNAYEECLQESRMREIRTSGLMRGSNGIGASRPLLSTLLDDDGKAYLFFGGIWGGQLQKWKAGQFDPNGEEPEGSEPALCPKVAVLADDMKSFASPITDLRILDENGAPLRADDHDRRFFEATWMHKRDGIYYFSYSTGNTHRLVYATGTSPLGPFIYAGCILDPVVGWTTHHSIVEFQGRWFLFHHDSSLSGGCNHLRCVKVKELVYDAEGRMHLAKSGSSEGKVTELGQNRS